MAKWSLYTGRMETNAYWANVQLYMVMPLRVHHPQKQQNKQAPPNKSPNLARATSETQNPSLSACVGNNA
eukprot:11200176-Lingulodinium_polyedra.AAC.1